MIPLQNILSAVCFVSGIICYLRGEPSVGGSLAIFNLGDRMQVYQFKMWGKKFAVDIESGNFFELDKIGSEVITLLHLYSEEEAEQKLKKRYKTKSITRKLT